MFVIGGVQFSSENSVPKLREFDLEKGIWKFISAKGDIPLGRVGHTLLTYDINTILMFGGVITLQENLVQDNNLYIFQLGTRS
ncbi:hypothetical protein LSM04_004826 [Trypanosoma melophagium]|uniref:uncharacterized protein n=1 Tax=Trypanosoma melophagium TaxID=715481 RepID=UPI00351A2825|nr:hypothetical protein LSM04_004826 [Trypanosoma melophagium]